MSWLRDEIDLETLIGSAGELEDGVLGSFVDDAVVEYIFRSLGDLENELLNLSAWQQQLRQIELAMNEDPAFKTYVEVESLSSDGDFVPASRTYIRLARRRALALANEGSSDARRPPSFEEGCQFARVILAGVLDKKSWEDDWDRDRESLIRNATLKWLLRRDAETLLKRIAASEKSAYSYDILLQICAELAESGVLPPAELLVWHFEATQGIRQRPPEKPAPRHRPRKPGYYLRNEHILRALHYLNRVGMPPTSGEAPGCRVVAQVMHPPWKERPLLKELTIKGIWAASLIPVDEFVDESFRRLTGIPDS